MITVAGRIEDHSNWMVLLGFILLFFWKEQKVFHGIYHI